MSDKSSWLRVLFHQSHSNSPPLRTACGYGHAVRAICQSEADESVPQRVCLPGCLCARRCSIKVHSLMSHMLLLVGRVCALCEVREF